MVDYLNTDLAPPAVHFRGIRGQWGPFRIDDLDLSVNPGEYFVILGASGCGKTTLIEILCGLRRHDAGRLLIGDRDVTHLAPGKRRVGYLPQDYALFPTMKVAQNIEFGLRMRHVRRTDRRGAALQTAELLGITHLMNERIHGLSGGERQRVALARALAIGTRLLILDEPVSALDEVNREEVCFELRRLHDELGLTCIHVCHNLEEMYSVADDVGIMNAGTFLQTGRPADVAARPAGPQVARIMQLGNVLYGRVTGKGPSARADLDIGLSFDAPNEPAGEAAWLLRRTDIQVLTTPPTGAALLTVHAIVQSVRRRNGLTRIVFSVPRGLIADQAAKSPSTKPGQNVILAFPRPALCRLI